MQFETKPLLQKLMPSDEQRLQSNNFDEVLDAIKQDVEGLLNSFAAAMVWHRSQSELNQSVLSFGLPNYMAEDYNANEKKIMLCEQIKKCIELKEPRLFAVKVFMQDDSESSDLIMHIRIDAKIYWQAQTKAVSLQSDWNPLNMSFDLL